MRLKFVLLPTAVPAELEVLPRELTFEEARLLGDRLDGSTVCRLEYGSRDPASIGKRKPGRPRRSRDVRLSWPPVPLRLEEASLASLLEAVRTNEAEIMDATHRDLRKRFRANLQGQRIESDKRVVVYDRKYGTVMEYDDPVVALDVYVRLIAASVVGKKDLEMLEWRKSGWVKLDPGLVEKSPTFWHRGAFAVEI